MTAMPLVRRVVEAEPSLVDGLAALLIIASAPARPGRCA